MLWGYKLFDFVSLFVWTKWACALTNHCDVLMCKVIHTCSSRLVIEHWGSERAASTSEQEVTSVCNYLCVCFSGGCCVRHRALLSDGWKEKALFGQDGPVFFIEDILKRRNRKNTGVNNKISDGWIPFNCFNFRVLISSLSHCHTVILDTSFFSKMLQRAWVNFPVSDTSEDLYSADD